MKLKNEAKQWLVCLAFALIWLMIYIFLNLPSSSSVHAVQEQPEGLIGLQYSEPCSNSSVKTYMDYRTITSPTSKQYQIIQERLTISNGFLIYDGLRIGVALGSAFGEVGSKWDFILSSGLQLNVIKIEEKADEHTLNGCQHETDGSVIEFVIDTTYEGFDTYENGYLYGGNFNKLDMFSGTIEKARKVE